MADELGRSAKAVYEELENDRKTYITRAEECAKYTIPSLFPKTSDNSSTQFKTPHQAVGARGVNNLSSKFLNALFPPNSPYFRLSMNDSVQAELLQMGQEVKADVEQALMQIEQKIIRYMETRQIRPTNKEVLNHLVVAGNCLMFLPPLEGGAKLYKLSSYVVQRDALGSVIEIVAVDKLSYATLPQTIKTLISSDGKQRKANEPIEVYTHTYLDGEIYRSYQEIEEKKIPGSEQMYPKDKCPWLALRLVKVDGESYGRSYVEEYLGDLKSLDILEEAMHNYSAIAGHIVYLVNPTGTTQVRRIASAKSGAFVPGRKEDISVLQLDKANDMSIAKSHAQALESRLSFIFLLNSALQRNAERVTAEEIRRLAVELEDTLGGIYSVLSNEFQLPLVKCIMEQMQRNGSMPMLPDGAVEPAITTGLEALGRGQDLNKLQLYLQFMAQIPGAAEATKMDKLNLMIATAIGLDTTGLVKTPEEIQAEREQQMMMEMAQRAAPQAAAGLMKGD